MSGRMINKKGSKQKEEIIYPYTQSRLPSKRMPKEYHERMERYKANLKSNISGPAKKIGGRKMPAKVLKAAKQYASENLQAAKPTMANLKSATMKGFSQLAKFYSHGRSKIGYEHNREALSGLIPERRPARISSENPGNVIGKIKHLMMEKKRPTIASRGNGKDRLLAMKPMGKEITRPQNTSSTTGITNA